MKKQQLDRPISDGNETDLKIVSWNVVSLYRTRALKDGGMWTMTSGF
jgi:hypothetical protein